MDEKPERWYFYDEKNHDSRGMVMSGRPLLKREIQNLVDSFRHKYIYCSDSDAPSWLLNSFYEKKTITIRDKQINTFMVADLKHKI